MSGLLDAVTSAAGKAVDTAGTIRNITNEGIHIVSGLMPGCVQVPEKAKNIYVFFIIENDGENYYVSGNMTSEKDRIISHLLDSYKYVIFRPADVKEYGLPDIAAGEGHFENYRYADAGQLMTLRQQNPKLYYIATESDAEYLKLRLETLGVGKVVTRQDMDSKISSYTSKSRGLSCNPRDVMYQCVLDIAMSLS